MSDKLRCLQVWCDLRRNIGAVHMILSLKEITGCDDVVAAKTTTKLQILPQCVSEANKTHSYGSRKELNELKKLACVHLPGVWKRFCVCREMDNCTLSAIKGGIAKFQMTFLCLVEAYSCIRPLGSTCSWLTNVVHSKCYFSK